MSATNRYFNSSGWGFTPTSGSLTPITGIKSAAYDRGISTKKESADFDVYFTVSVNDFNDPKISLETIDAKVLLASVPGTKGTLVGSIRDAYNGVTASGGGFGLTMSNCQIEGQSAQFPYRDFAKQNISFGAISTDGATSPVAIAAL